MKKKVLFVCIHNSARSQMAEAFLNQICGKEFEAYSAGIEPGRLNPIVVEAMSEAGIDISGNRTKSVSDMLKSGKSVRLRHHCLRRGERRTLPDFPRRHHAAALGLSRPVRFSRHARGKAGQNPRSARRHQGENREMVRGSLLHGEARVKSGQGKGSTFLHAAGRKNLTAKNISNNT